MTSTSGTAWDVGSTPSTSSSRSLSTYARIASSCARMRSSSSSVRCRRANRATCRTSSRLSMGSLQLLEMGVLEREALAADAGEADRHDDVGGLALDTDHEALAPAGMAHPRTDLERQVVVRDLGGGPMPDLVGFEARRRRRARRVERGQLILRHLAQGARWLPPPR